MATSSPPPTPAEVATRQGNEYRPGTLRTTTHLWMLNFYSLMKGYTGGITSIPEGQAYHGSIRQDSINTFLYSGREAYSFPTELVEVTYDE